jgi:hypothetical protein
VSLSLPPGPDELAIPYSPHAPSSPRPVKPKFGTVRRIAAIPSSNGGKLALLAHSDSAGSLWPARRSSLLPPSTAQPGEGESELRVGLGTEEGRGHRLSFALEEEEMEVVEEAEEWFDQSRPRGRMLGLQRDHRLEASEAPDWTAYGHGSLDW